MQKKHHHHRKKPPQGILNNGNLFRDTTGMDALSKLTSEQIQAVSQNNANLTNAANQMAENAHQYNMNKQAVKDGLLHPSTAAAAARKQARENAKTHPSLILT
jgi:regulator of replication initiation timing